MTNDCTLTLTGVREYELTQLASVQPLQWRGLTVSRASSVWITHRQWERVYSWELPASHMLTLTQPHHSPLWLALLLKLPHQVHYGIWADAFSLVHFSSLSESQHLFLHFFCWGSIIVPSSVSSLHRSSIPSSFYISASSIFFSVHPSQGDSPHSRLFLTLSLYLHQLVSVTVSWSLYQLQGPPCEACGCWPPSFHTTNPIAAFCSIHLYRLIGLNQMTL